MNFTKKRWIVLIASCLINLCIGALYSWSVFAAPMAEYINQVHSFSGEAALSSSSLAIVFSIANCLGPITMILGGKFVKKIGPRWVILIGGLLFGVGMLISGFASSLAILIVGFGICCGLAAGLTYGCTVTNCVKFFPDKKGLAGGLAAASYGLSSVIVPLIANLLIEKFGVSSSFKILGIAVVILVSIASIWIYPCPDNFIIDGYQAKEKGSVKTNKDYTWLEMLKSSTFYIMVALMCCGAFMGMMIISQASSIAQKQIMMSASEAALAVSILALFNTAGRIVGGFISDKIGQVKTLMIFLALSIVGLLLLNFSKESSYVSFYIGVIIIGLCFGGFMGIYPGFTSERFGAKNSSVNFGIMFIGFALAGFFAPIIISNIYASSGSYSAAYIVAMVLSALGIALSILILIRDEKEKKKEV